MLLKSPWNPWISYGNGPIYRCLAISMAKDIVDGTIPPGARLPAHRDLSFQLAISLGTVTKAYALLERQGLVNAIRGRGMFVVEHPPLERSVVDLSVNFPPNVIPDRLLSATLRSLAGNLDSETFGYDTPTQGRHEHRLAIAGWLQQYCASVDAERMVLCASTQNAIMVVLQNFTASNICLATDNIPFPQFCKIAALFGVELVGIETDGEGIEPGALERASQEAAARGKRMVLFSNHRLNNPTGKTMSGQRFEDIVRILRSKDMLVIEDDIYGAFADPNSSCFLDSLPDRTFYVTGVSKLLTPGVRIGVIIPPPDRAEKTIDIVSATGAGLSTIASSLLFKWIEDGVAGDVAAMTLEEAKYRRMLARRCFSSAQADITVCGLHAFVPMPYNVAVDFAERASDAGILVTLPARPLNGNVMDSGVRVCLGVPPRNVLARALETLGDIHKKISAPYTFKKDTPDIGPANMTVG